MKMSEILEGNFVLPVKFVAEEHADDLLNGNLFMKNLKYFIDLEKNTGIKGRGDKREAAHVIRSQHVKVIDPKTEKVIATANEGEIIERYTNAPKVPVFCFTLFKSDDFNFVKEENGKYVFEWNLSEEEKQMFKDFGDKAVILPEDFVQKVVNKAEEAGNAAFIKEVQYIDYDVVDEKRKRSFDNKEIDFFFWKDKTFEGQREARIILPGQLVDDHLKYYVPDLDGGSNIVDTKYLFNNLMISIEKKK